MAVVEQFAERESSDHISFARLETGNGVNIIDHIERRHFPIKSATEVHPTKETTDLFDFPVGSAVTINTGKITLPHQFGAMIRNSMGFMVAEITKGESRTFPRDRYSIDPGASIKTYIVFDEGFTIESAGEGITITLDSPSDIHIGARSHHKQPAGNITATEDISDLMIAFSSLSSSLKTLSCERSYPTLRGHPPLINIGDTLNVPSVLDVPDTEVTIAIPPQFRYLLGVSSLAFYLGADIVEGERPTLSTDKGFEYSLGSTWEEFETEVEEVLKQTFFLDCITRTEGLFQVDLHERKQVAPHIDFSFAELYDQPISRQLEAYLEVPYTQIEPHIPTWKLTARVEPTISAIEAVPFLVNELAVVKPEVRTKKRKIPAVTSKTREFFRNSSSGEASSVRSSSASIPPAETFRFERPENSSHEQAWVGEGIPIGASKVMVQAYENRLGRTPTDGDIDITVVCNSVDMDNEINLVNEVYGSRDELPFDISMHNELSVEELRDVLAADTEFLHYIGHIDSEGFECHDGRLDASSLDETGVDVFFLNACTSYAQGRHLIEAGSIAGVVTLNDVINSGAERIGGTLARLLNCGFPLQIALNLASEESIMGGHYLVIGDGGVEIAQPEGSTPAIPEIEDSGEYWTVNYYTVPTREKGLGTIVNPTIEKCNEFYLNSGTNGKFELTTPEVTQFARLREIPVRIDDELSWTTEFQPGG